MSPTRRLLLTVTVVTSLLVLFLTKWNKNPWPRVEQQDTNAPPSPHFPRKIWQTWRHPAQGLEEELQRFTRTWVDLNPGYRYELLTDQAALTYVRENFGDRKNIVHIFEETELKIFHADLIRYLVLLKDGGVYTDIDTHCTKPIEEWIPSEDLESANLIVGLEFDSRGGPIFELFSLPVRLTHWTLIARPGNGALEHVVDRVAEAVSNWRDGNRAADSIKYWREDDSSPTLPTTTEALDITGPTIFTKAIFEYLSWRERRTVHYEEVSNIKKPMLVGDVLFMPVSAFASGQMHSGSKPWDNDEQLLSHHWHDTFHKELG